MTHESIASRILLLRGQRVMLDADLAELYGVPTKALSQAVKRNSRRFPPDFMFQFTTLEKREVVTNSAHLARRKFARTRPFAMTEHGSIQASKCSIPDRQSKWAFMSCEPSFTFGNSLPRTMALLRATSQRGLS